MSDIRASDEKSAAYRYVIGHTSVNGRWVEVYSTDTGDDHIKRAAREAATSKWNTP